MAGRVDDVDPVVAPGDRRVLRENGDAALALQTFESMTRSCKSLRASSVPDWRSS
jgi:hypothetical protein